MYSIHGLEQLLPEMENVANWALLLCRRPANSLTTSWEQSITLTMQAAHLIYQGWVNGYPMRVKQAFRAK